LKSKLIKGDALAFGLLDGGAGAGSEAQSADGTAEILLIEGASTVGANIVSDGANNDANVVLALGGKQLGQAGSGHDRAVGAGHEKALQNNLVELRICAAHEKAVKLDEQLQVNVVAQGDL